MQVYDEDIHVNHVCFIWLGEVLTCACIFQSSVAKISQRPRYAPLHNPRVAASRVERTNSQLTNYSAYDIALLFSVTLDAFCDIHRLYLRPCVSHFRSLTAKID